MKIAPINVKDVPEKIIMAKSSKEDGKLWAPLWTHAIDAALVMEYLLENWVSSAGKRILSELCDGELSTEGIYATGRFLALAHDLGKATPEFQYDISFKYPSVRQRLEDGGLKLREKSERSFKHAFAGQRILLRDLDKSERPFATACIIGAHHGKPAENSAAGPPPSRDENWRNIQNKWIDYSLRQSGFDSLKELPKIKASSQTIWTGLLIASDWIASNAYYFPLIDLDDDGSDIDYVRRIKTAFKKLRFTKPWIAEEIYKYEDIYKNRFGFTPNSAQLMTRDAAVEAEKPGIFILEAQMGIGKTEAALAAAEIIASKTGSGGVYFGLPTRATVDGAFGRLSAWVEKLSSAEPHSIRLLHGAAEFNEDYQNLRGNANLSDDEGGVVVNEWFSGRKQALLADFVVGTVDGLLAAGLKQKHVMLRHLGLANKVVIVDECHAYDAYMNQYLETVLRWLGAYRAPVILLSATLPAERRAALTRAYLNERPDENETEPDWTKNQAYPLLTWTDGGVVKQKTLEGPLPNRRAILDFSESEDDEFENLALELKEKLKDGGRVGIITNAVKRAQKCSETFRKYFPEDEVRLIHSQFMASDRAERERELVEILGKNGDANPAKPKRLIVVGTQVLEQSLDIDFDYLASDLCPMDLLLQRIGRLHRRSGVKRPEAFKEATCKILRARGDALEEAASAIYGKYLLIRTREILKDKTEILLPADISPLVQKTYDKNWNPRTVTPEYAEAEKEHNDLIKSKQAKADVFRVGPPNAGVRLPYIYGWLDMSDDRPSPTDREGTAAVRDADPSIEVLCVRRGDDDKIYLMSDKNFEFPISPLTTPCEEEAKKIARQRLRLPHILCVGKRFDETVGFLEEETERNFKEWLYSGWLHGELFLIFNEDGEAAVNNFRLRYSDKDGLEVRKEGI